MRHVLVAAVLAALALVSVRAALGTEQPLSPGAPATSPSAIPLPSADGPTTTADNAGKSLSLVAPARHCWEVGDSQLIRSLIEKVVLGPNVPYKLLAGYKECPGQDPYYTGIGAFVTFALTEADYNARGADVRREIGGACSMGGLYVSPSGTLDDPTATQIAKTAKKVLDGTAGDYAEAAIIGQRGPACYLARIWASGPSATRVTRLEMSAVFMLRDRLVIFSNSSLYLGSDRAKQDYTLMTQIVDRLFAMNP